MAAVAVARHAGQLWPLDFGRINAGSERPGKRSVPLDPPSARPGSLRIAACVDSHSNLIRPVIRVWQVWSGYCLANSCSRLHATL